MQVRPRLASARNTVNSANRLAIHKNDPLVAKTYGWHIGLHHDRFAAASKEHLEKGAEILITRRQPENTGTAIAEQGLYNDIAVRIAKGPNGFSVAADQRWRHQVRKQGDQKLFGGVAHFGRIVHHHRFRWQHFKKMRCSDVIHVKGRVLTHQDDIKVRQRPPFHAARIKMVTFDIAQCQGLANCLDTAFIQGQPVRRIIPQGVAT